MIGYSTVNQKGQVTIPAGIRSALGLKPNNHVVVTKVDDTVTIKPVVDIYGLRGSVKASAGKVDYKKVRKSFENFLARSSH